MKDGIGKPVMDGTKTVIIRMGRKTKENIMKLKNVKEKENLMTISLKDLSYLILKEGKKISRESAVALAISYYENEIFKTSIMLLIMGKENDQS
jgi:hypothetical protein